ncbi:hypothetical protein [Actinomadura litoris]|uniref:Uncharacterized protein n=1 Tax=Actinomadura litoris TaxID=2678616 RepID=A0A7K1LAC5_9ACTN|nr:hypothetical protein [Actinomadura litoris]MUN41387.1 hypothetical protein [Actinomadura litoris]
MAKVTIGLRIGRNRDGKGVVPPRDTVELDRLSPRARALAQAIAASPGAGAGVIWLESTRPRGEMYTSGEEHAVYGDPARDGQPVRREWGAWDRFYADSPEDAYGYLERQAAKIPADWEIIGPDPHERVTEHEQPVEEWRASDVAEHMGIALPSVRPTLRRLGVRPYRHEPAPGGGVRAVYSAAAVRAAHANRPGRGARTDLKGHN